MRPAHAQSCGPTSMRTATLRLLVPNDPFFARSYLRLLTADGSWNVAPHSFMRDTLMYPATFASIFAAILSSVVFSDLTAASVTASRTHFCVDPLSTFLFSALCAGFSETLRCGHACEPTLSRHVSLSRWNDQQLQTSSGQVPIRFISLSTNTGSPRTFFLHAVGTR